MRAAAGPYRPPPDASVTLAFVDDAAMRELNRRYRGSDRTTDVLSFGQRLPRGAKGAAAVRALAREADGTLDLGDVVISGPQAARQARRRRWPLASEVAFLAAHGVLHLLGFDDATRAGYVEMRTLGTEAMGPAVTASGRGCSRAGTRASRGGTPRRRPRRAAP